MKATCSFGKGISQAILSEGIIYPHRVCVKDENEFTFLEKRNLFLYHLLIAL
jgi:hypothetical protein